MTPRLKKLGILLEKGTTAYGGKDSPSNCPARAVFRMPNANPFPSSCRMSAIDEAVISAKRFR